MEVKGVCFAVVIIAAFSVGFGEEKEAVPGSNSNNRDSPVQTNEKGATTTTVTANEDNAETNDKSKEKDTVTPEIRKVTNVVDDYPRLKPGVTNNTVSEDPKEDQKTKSSTNNTASEDPKEDQKTKSSSETERIKPALDAISVKLLEAEENGIELSDITLDKQLHLKNRTRMRVFSIDFHVEKKLLFYAAEDKIFKEMYTSRFSSGDAVVVEDEGVDGPLSIAVDWIHDRLYWLSIRQNTVESTSLNGTDRTLIIDSLVSTLYPNNIAVDPYEKFIFFVSNHTIYKAFLDGKYLTDIQLNGTEGRAVKHLALDTRQKRIYYTGKDGHYNTGQPYLATCDYEGQHVRELPIGKPGWNDFFSLAVFRNTLYFAHYPKTGADSVWSADLTKTTLNLKQVYSVGDDKGGLWSIKVFHPDVQEQP